MFVVEAARAKEKQNEIDFPPSGEISNIQRVPRTMALAPSFPTFSDWPKNKREYVNNMSAQQRDAGSEFIIVSEAYQKKFRKCTICTERFKFTFDQDLEEWVYRGCKILRGTPYHYPLCWKCAHDE